MSDDLFSHCVPVLPVNNATETAQFYKDKLGFDIAFAFGEPAFYVILKRGKGTIIHLSEREDTTTTIQPCHVYVFVTNVDAVYDEYMSRGLKIAEPPHDHDYGMREIELVDPEGHFLTFGQEL